MMNDVTLYGQREDYDYQPGGRAVKGIRATFGVGQDGPFSVFLSDADYSADNMTSMIEAKADAVRETRAHPSLRGR